MKKMCTTMEWDLHGEVRMDGDLMYAIYGVTRIYGYRTDGEGHEEEGETGREARSLIYLMCNRCFYNFKTH